MVTQPRYRTRRFILRQPRAIDEVAAVARLHGWTYVREQPSETGKLHYVTLEAGLPGLLVLYFEHYDPDLCGIAIDSTLGPEPINTVATLVQGTLVPWMLTELLDEIDNGADRAFALRCAGFGVPSEADPAFLARFSATAEDSEPDVRIASIFAMAETGWPECGPILEKTARTDRDPAVRRLAARGAEVLPTMRPEGMPVAVDISDLFPDGAADLHRFAMRQLTHVIMDA
ncbi:HEAT repeat domain-containing protein [Streptomyces aculeolatus]